MCGYGGGEKSDTDEEPHEEGGEDHDGADHCHPRHPRFPPARLRLRLGGRGQFDDQHRAFYAEEDGIIHGEEGKPANEDSPKVK